MSYISHKLKKTCIPNKGYGYIANEDIKCGETLIKEIPFTIPTDNIYSDIFQLLYEVFKDTAIITQFMKLHPKTIELIHNIDQNNIIKELSKVKNHNAEIYNFFTDNYTTNDIILFCAKYMCNAFCFKGKPAFLFNGTIMNHSCLPNTIFGEVGGKIIFKAGMDIKKGNEIYDNYIDITQCKLKRKEHLLSQYGFICNCERCIETKDNIIKKHNANALDIENKRFDTFGFTKSKNISNDRY